MRQNEYPGDIVEVGVLIGSGTAHLSRSYPERSIWAVDVFDIYHDTTKNQDGVSMWKFYETELSGQNQFDLYLENIKEARNVKTYVGSSETFAPPDNIWITILDGEHTPEAVEQDYKKFWRSRFVAFHDYNHDIPELTIAIDKITKGKERHVLPGWLIIAN